METLAAENRRVRLGGKLIEGVFVARDNRFRVTVALEGEPVWAHLANSGRLGELLVPNRRVFVSERPGAKRKTRYDLTFVEMEGALVSVDARLPNDLVEEGLHAGWVAPLSGYSSIRREVMYGNSRFDFLLEAPARRPCLVEVKSVTLVLDGLGCFPDAVTARGRRHVNELAESLGAGYRAAVVFVVQREDVAGWRPHDESDPDFGRALREAASRGVEVYAYGCRIDPGVVQIAEALPVHLKLAH